MPLFYFKYPATSGQTTFPTKLLFKSTTTLSLIECRKILGPMEVFNVDDKNICTTNSKGKGVCFGDSGIDAVIHLYYKCFMEKYLYRFIFEKVVH